ncbi:uncharacterized protein UMAG_04688 [Mycosarcoma maydis]|uniref:Zn(2)-C6 fungal-type domain-containing protein n=1 Tax=Mycosarcoma maydis TaxID=5270 RepID=A0A0D1DTI6_MYCMD|nr:uncharacterized protein UMAG_04688 [Ustilago maydis 521]KIS67589.1 hypothetical protein UMAG_04688 [Ustilago maydis 521]|eukprot:XP_011390957.1 hypothetical protein UMAG_04688 [Ustilago maydis 521]
MGAKRGLSISSVASSNTESCTSSNSAIVVPSKSRRKRTQYRSCDQCRTSKRACDLSGSTLSACSTCATRQIKCTAYWLGQKNPKRLRPHSEAALVTPPSPTLDSSIASDALAEHVKGCKLRMYVTIFEFPFSHWLAPGCNPYLLSFDTPDADSPEGELARFIRLTSGAHDQLQGSSTAPSRLLKQLSVLDALLLHCQLQQRGITIEDIGEARLRSIYERNKVIDEAYTWAAVTHASQFTATADFFASGAQRAEARTRSRTLTSTAWQKARKALFSNVSFNSFRNAFAFIIFGITAAPTLHGTGQSSFNEDTAFAIAHGLKLMHVLCQSTKTFLDLPGNHCNKAALHALQVAMWLNEICKAVLTPVINRWLKDDAVAMLSVGLDSLTPTHDLTLVRNQSFVRSLVGGDMGYGNHHDGIVPIDCLADQAYVDPWTQVVEQAQSSLMSSAILSFKLDACAVGQLIGIGHELNEASAYKTLIWKMVADLEADPSSPSAIDVAIAITKQWHVSHAIVLDAALAAYGRLEPESKTMLAFAVQHSSLGLFYLDALASKLKRDDSQTLRAWQAIDVGNLSSARRVAQVCARARQDALGGLTVTADQAEIEGCRNLAQTFPMGQWCHPFPALFLQAQSWAAHHLLRRAEECPEDPESAWEWIQLVDDCLFCLDMMHDSMTCFPSHALGKMPLEGLLERRATFPSYQF